MCSFLLYSKVNQSYVCIYPHFFVFLSHLKDLSVRLDTIKLLEENISRKFLDINCRKIFFNPLLQ